jgi:putative transposase
MLKPWGFALEITRGRYGEAPAGGDFWRNGHTESFNSRVRDERLNINMFWSLAQAQVVISDWKVDYNNRRHSALG